MTKICLLEICSFGKPTVNKQGCFGCIAISRLVSHRVIIEESQLQLLELYFIWPRPFNLKTTHSSWVGYSRLRNKRRPYVY